MERARPLTHAAAALAGLPPAFFFVFAGVFSDPSGLDERLVSLGLVVFAYATLGFLFARFLPGGWGAGLWVSSAAVAIVVLYTLQERHDLGLHLLYLVSAVAPAVAGAWSGARLRRRGPASPSPP